jgi:gluconate kinase
LSGTLEIEAETERMRQDGERMRQDRERMRQEDEKLDAMILQTRSEAKQNRERDRADERAKARRMKSENARLAELESKIDGLFSKYNIKLPQGKTPEQP